MSHPHPQHHPSRRPGHPISCILQHPRERTLAVSTDHVHRLPPQCIATTTGNCFPRTSTITSAPAPSCMGCLASYTWQQLREVRSGKLDGGFGSAHTNPLAVVHVPAVLCVNGVTGCTAESSRAFGGNAPVLCSTVVDAARNGGSGSQAHSSHVGGCVSSKLLCMLDVQPHRR
jgi:hypothetical protein